MRVCGYLNDADDGQVADQLGHCAHVGLLPHVQHARALRLQQWVHLHGNPFGTVIACMQTGSEDEHTRSTYTSMARSAVQVCRT